MSNAPTVASFVSFMERSPANRLTLGQRVIARVAFDGADPVDLADDEKAMAAIIFGPTCERVPRPARRVLAWLKGARLGGSWLCAQYLTYRALTADLSRLALGEMAFAPIVAPDMKTGRQTLRHALGLARAIPSVAQLIESTSTDGFVLKRRDGRSVAIECLAASRGGASVRGRSMVAACMDESLFFLDEANGVINDAEIFRALVVRIISGGVLCMISTAWNTSGLLMETIEANHGKPTDALAAVSPTLLVRPDDPELIERIEVERRRDPATAAREYDCVPLTGAASSFIDPAAIDAMVDPSLPPAWGPV